MNRDELLRVLRASQNQNLEYVLTGATALGFHGLIRATEDVDLMIRSTSENIERLRKAFQETYSDDPSIQEIRAEDLLGDFPTTRYYPVNGELFFYILTRLGDAASYETIESEIIAVEGVRVQTTTPQALFKLKKGTVRPIDRQDAQSSESDSK